MGFFGMFKKKTSAPEQKHWTETPPPGFEDSSEIGMDGQMRPLQPLEYLRPQENDKPGSINQAELHTLLVKLDLIATKLDMLTQRLAQLEFFIQGNASQQQFREREPLPLTQQRPQSPYQRW